MVRIRSNGGHQYARKGLFHVRVRLPVIGIRGLGCFTAQYVSSGKDPRPLCPPSMPSSLRQHRDKLWLTYYMQLPRQHQTPTGGGFSICVHVHSIRCLHPTVKFVTSFWRFAARLIDLRSILVFPSFGDRDARKRVIKARWFVGSRPELMGVHLHKFRKEAFLLPPPVKRFWQECTISSFRASTTAARESKLLERVPVKTSPPAAQQFLIMLTFPCQRWRNQ